jgi:hypothetical protein
VGGSKQLLYFAYAMTMKGVTQELDVLGKTLQEAFGVIGQVRHRLVSFFGLRTHRKLPLLTDGRKL